VSRPGGGDGGGGAVGGGRAASPVEQVVLGIDPGTAVTGYGVVLRRGGGGVTLLECGIIRTSPHTPLPARIREIYEGICELLVRFDPFAVAVEDVFQGKNVRSALTLGHARGAILLAASLQERIIAEYTPSEIKSAVAGSGRATKEQVAFMVQQQLRLKQAPLPCGCRGWSGRRAVSLSGGGGAEAGPGGERRPQAIGWTRGRSPRGCS
jgi:crossover junction endodeoxyribonuclease RuvC